MVGKNMCVQINSKDLCIKRVANDVMDLVYDKATIKSTLYLIFIDFIIKF